MDLEMNKISGTQVSPGQEVKIAKIGLDLYLGQAIRATVVQQISPNEVSININGQNVNAKTSQQFTPGETLDVKVVNTQDEITLQIQAKEAPSTALQKTILQNALLQALPKQAPPTNLLDNLSKLVDSGKLPQALNQQIKSLLANITPLTQLAQQLPKAINQSGVFLESNLLAWQSGTSAENLQADNKGQYLKLLDSFPSAPQNNYSVNSNQEINTLINRDNLPLPGAVPQPLHKDATSNITEHSPAIIQAVIHEQVNQVLSRITASQIHHLNSDDNKNGFLIMLDVPIKTSEKEIDVIPLMIKQRKATATQPSQWSLSFALNLSQLGDLQGTVSINGNNVNLKINTDKPETINILHNNQEEMSTVLSELGLNLHDFHVQLGLESNQISTENLHLLDIRI